MSDRAGGSRPTAVDPLALEVLARAVTGVSGPSDDPSRADGAVARPGRDGLGVAWSFLALPTLAAPRLLVRADRPRTGAAAVRRQMTGRGARAALRRTAVAAAVGSGAARLWRRGLLVAPVTGAPDTLVRVLAQQLGREVELACVALGPARANRKAVAQLVEPDGSMVGWAKIGHDPLTARLVRAEHEALTAVATELADVVHVPQVLAAGRWLGLEVVVTAPLETGGKGSVDRPDLLAVVRAVHRTTGAAAAPSVTALVAGQPRLAPLTAIALRTDAVAPALRPGAWHGDLHPDNLAVAPDGRPVLWDWERWQGAVPLGADLLHHDLQRWLTVDGLARRTAAERLVARAADLLGPLGVGADEAPLVATDYLIRLAARYLTDRQSAAGAAVGDVETWIVPALLGATTWR
jgi:hypothetical protein